MSNRPSLRLVLFRVVLISTVVLLIVLLTVLRVPALNDDFMAYWSAATLLAHGTNPYDPFALLSVQQSAGWRFTIPLPTWYAPWLLAAFVPMSLLPYWPARVGWMLAQVAALLGSVRVLWRWYGGSHDSRPFLLAATFAPTIFCIAEGQITPLILLGFAVALLCLGQHRDWLAGAALLPLTAKPLTLYLIWPELLLWSFRSFRWKFLVGLGLAVALGSAVALSFHRSVFQEWFDFSAMFSPLEQNYTPTFGTVLRYLFGVENYWLAYLPAVAGGIWLLANWRRDSPGSRWTERLPSLVFASLLTTPFMWSHDALLLLPAVFQTATRRWTTADAAFWFPLNAVAVILYPFLRLNQVWYLLYVLALLGWYIWNRTHAVSSEAVSVL